jgi:hypothetical protein
VADFDPNAGGLMWLMDVYGTSGADKLLSDDQQKLFADF